MSEPRCHRCRFGHRIGRTLARCLWVTETEDEAGDRMPAWAHEIVREHPSAIGRNDRAQRCPALEALPDQARAA